MLSVKLSKTIGFCSGVKRAIGIIEDTLSKSKNKIYSLGAVIHNPLVIKHLKEKGLVVVESLTDIPSGSTVILPSHGTPRCILNSSKKRRLNFIDVICPYVSKLQITCQNLYSQGYTIVIIGDKRHPEVMALKEIASGAYVIEKASDVSKNVFSHKKIGIIAQTTQSRDTFFKLISLILDKNPLVKEVHIFNTICRDTSNRQEEVKRIAGRVDVMLVVGSRISANTKRLLSIGLRGNKNTYLIESEDQVSNNILKGAKKVGLISGASAPEWLVRKIVKKIKNHKKER